MSMPIFAWAAYVRKASKELDAAILRMAIATTLPHLEQGDRMRVVSSLQQTEEVQEQLSKEEYIAQMRAAGIGVELN